ncbi:hypothetical protein BKA63DRAFT_577590 [Paraphoma chrysanthemicola]|nr:hypothetical protein BKA63DRAFT_577590 [Paraphoma chrysanthemicola]
MQNKDPYPRSKLYRQQYRAAAKLFDKDTEKSIALAKHNLSNMSLPRYYVIKNCILICCALEYWDDANIYRLTAESAYSVAFSIASQQNDKVALEALEDLRADLDELEAFRQEDLYVAPPEAQNGDDGYGDIDEMEGYEEGAEDEDMEAADEQKTVAEVKNEMEVAADSWVLPIRPLVDSDTTTTTAVDATATDAMAAKALSTVNIVTPAKESASPASQASPSKEQSVQQRWRLSRSALR